MTILTVDHIDYHIGNRPLLSQASFSIESGERIALIGRNGEGKSTLLNILAGNLQAEDGSVLWQTGSKAALLRERALMSRSLGTLE